MAESKSPPTDRVLDVIEHLARHESPQRLRDVVGALGLSHATGSSILAALCDRGWATRDPRDRSFSLGPALAATAAFGHRARPLAQATSDSAIELANRTGYAVSVSERLGDVLLISSFASPEGIDGTSAAADVAGDRLPYTPPFGPAFAAWDDDGGAAWIDRGARAGTPLAGQLDRVLRATRARGFSVERLTPTLRSMMQFMGRIDAGALDERVRGLIADMLEEITAHSLLDAATAYPVSAVAAPVRDSRGRVVMNLAVHPFRDLEDSALDAVTNSLLETTEAIVRD